MRAISLFRRDAGTSTRWCLAAEALRMLVKKSAIGSVCIVFRGSPLPTGLGYAGNFTLERHAAEADAAHLELANVSAGAATDAATVALAHLKFWFLQFLDNFRGARH